MTNSLFWCIASKGSLIAKTAMSRTVRTDNMMTARLNGLLPNRCANGRVNEATRKPSTDTMVAMTLSAGASPPIRPVYRNETPR